jgi:hypothetical protein
MWDTPHSALPRQGIGSSTDAVSLDVFVDPHPRGSLGQYGSARSIGRPR